MVMEECCGGDLYSREPYTEDQAARIICSTLSALQYMHSLHICHRDIKFENIMFVDESPDATVKLIDFGVRRFFTVITPLYSEALTLL